MRIYEFLSEWINFALQINMLDIFTIFSKGGIVLWFFQGNSSLIPLPPVNALIKSVILQERVHQDLFNYENLSLKFKVRIG